MIDNSDLDKGTNPSHDFTNDSSQSERKRMLRQDAAALRSGDREVTTYSRLAQMEDDLGGRYAEPKYPAAANWSHDPVPPEPVLGWSVDSLPDMTTVNGDNTRDLPEWQYGAKPEPVAADDTATAIEPDTIASPTAADARLATILSTALRRI
jgi:hypothetical protein